MNNSNSILCRLTDAHNHLCDNEKSNDTASEVIDRFNEIETGKLCIMSSSLPTQSKVAESSTCSSKVIPCFGLHPWWTHHISIEPEISKENHYLNVFECAPEDLAPYLPHLPIPLPLSTFLKELEINLKGNETSLLGEVGLDKSMHCPSPQQLLTRNLEENQSQCCPPILTIQESTKFKVLKPSINHQLIILESQVSIAIKLHRNISFHCVKAPDDTVKLFKKLTKLYGKGWKGINVCLHSFGGSAETAKRLQSENSNLYFSFSTLVSLRSPKADSLILAIDPNRILLETDTNQVEDVDNLMLDIFERVRNVRGWDPDEMVDRMESNWKAFIGKYEMKD